jgi:hypothetical protein
MEALTRMMTAIVDKGLFLGFLVGSRNNEELSVSHLLLVDDTWIFCDANSEQIRHFRCIFLHFDAVSGLKINVAKSKKKNFFFFLISQCIINQKKKKKKKRKAPLSTQRQRKVPQAYKGNPNHKCL